MRVLLDECLPRRLKAHLDADLVKTVPECGWAGLSNGELLRTAAAEFDVFITIDGSLPFQQALPTIDLGVVVLTAKSNRFQDVLLLAPEVNDALRSAAQGRVVRIPANEESGDDE